MFINPPHLLQLLHYLSPTCSQTCRVCIKVMDLNQFLLFLGPLRFCLFWSLLSLASRRPHSLVLFLLLWFFWIHLFYWILKCCSWVCPLAPFLSCSGWVHAHSYDFHPVPHILMTPAPYLFLPASRLCIVPAIWIYYGPPTPYVHDWADHQFSQVSSCDVLLLQVQNKKSK